MQTITRYILINTEGVAENEEFSNYDIALEIAKVIKSAIIKRTYTVNSIELVWVPDNATVWPDGNVSRRFDTCAWCRDRAELFCTDRKHAHDEYVCKKCKKHLEAFDIETRGRKAHDKTKPSSHP